MTKNQEKTQEALARIDTALENITSDKDWLAFLAFQGNFYNYSFGNTLLIFDQRPDATFVKGYRAWNDLGRYVKRGSKGITILAPLIKTVEAFAEPADKAVYQQAEGKKTKKKKLVGFRTVTVFDISDTDGDDSRIPVLVRGLSGNSKQEQELYEKLKSVISTEHPVQEVKGIGAKGLYNRESGIISVRADMEALQKIKTVLHEFGHAVDFRLHPDEDIQRNQRELIAESTAFVVASHLGLDTSSYSMSYLQSWLKNKNELKTVAGAIQEVAAEIIEKLAGADPAFSILNVYNKEEVENG